MKGIVVFDDRSDLAFYSLDKELEQYIRDRVKTLEGEAGAEVSCTCMAVAWRVSTLIEGELKSLFTIFASGRE